MCSEANSERGSEYQTGPNPEACSELRGEHNVALDDLPAGALWPSHPTLRREALVLKALGWSTVPQSETRHK